MAVEIRPFFFYCLYNNSKITLFLTMVLPLKYDETGYSRTLQDLEEIKKKGYRQKILSHSIAKFMSYLNTLYMQYSFN